MKILVLNGSPTRDGNTVALVNAFKEGAETNGHKVTVLNVAQKKVNGCLACECCHGKGQGQCVQQDDMQEIYPLMREAEMMVIAAPIYFHGMSGQMKCAIDRLYPMLFPKKPEKLSKVAMFLSSGEPDMYDGALFSYQGDFLDFLGLEGMGVFTMTEEEAQHPEDKLAGIRAFGAGL